MGRAFVFTLLLALLGGSAFLATRVIPPDSHKVEKVLSNDKFLK